mgnify:FL=1|jgi:hypothetical protein|tara:strand:- start:2001 stop:2579 length:579 start_codon:yes stop_codon:yes gene_type:complete
MKKKFKYKVVREVLAPDMALFLSNYLRLKREVFLTIRQDLPNGYLGIYPDSQCPNAFATYGDIAMETLLVMVKPVLEKYLKMSLIPTYAYARVYEKGSDLKKHKDRKSCDFSTTMNLGGDLWPIYIDNKKVNLKPGDMLIYRGCDLTHWRDEFKGNFCSQVFLHYNDSKDKYNLFDGRKHLGLPHYTKRQSK